MVDQPQSSVNTQNDAFKSIYQELVNLRKLQADTAAQVQRIQRTVKLDEREFAIGQQQSNREVIKTMASLTSAVNSLVSQQSKAAGQDEGQSLFYGARAAEGRDAKKRLAYIRRLAGLTQRTVAKCPCGEKHKGIMFYDPTSNVVVDTLCPRVWWIKLSRLAYEEGRLEAFVKATPLSDYLSAF